jgi:hypothetical protein
MYKDAQPARTAYGLVYPRATQGTLLSPPHYEIHNLGSQQISTTD